VCHWRPASAKLYTFSNRIEETLPRSCFGARPEAKPRPVAGKLFPNSQIPHVGCLATKLSTEVKSVNLDVVDEAFADMLQGAEGMATHER
jgi:hypothetical protein